MKASRDTSAIAEFRINDLSDVTTWTNTFHLELVVPLEPVLKAHRISSSLALSHVDNVQWFVHLEICCTF